MDSLGSFWRNAGGSVKIIMVLTLLLEAWLNQDVIKEEWVERWLFCRGHIDTPYTKHI